MIDPRIKTEQYKLSDRQNKLVSQHNQHLLQLIEEVDRAREDSRRCRELADAKDAVLRAGELAMKLSQDARDKFFGYLAQEAWNVEDDEPIHYEENPPGSGKFVISIQVKKDDPPADRKTEEEPCSPPEPQL